MHYVSSKVNTTWPDNFVYDKENVRLKSEKSLRAQAPRHVITICLLITGNDTTQNSSGDPELPAHIAMA
jgi:hypothetical protein